MPQNHIYLMQLIQSHLALYQWKITAKYYLFNKQTKYKLKSSFNTLFYQNAFGF